MNKNKIIAFHATNEYFNKFKETTDIGYHFGSASAAMDRLKAIPSPEIVIEKNDVSDLDKAVLNFENDLKRNPDLKRFCNAKKQGFNINQVVYHGTAVSGYNTDTDIVSFDKTKIGARFCSDESGFFFTNFQKFASDYASSDTRLPEDGRGAVYPVYLKMKNPLVIDANFLKKENMEAIGIREDTIGFWDNYQFLIKEWIECSNGKYDGVILQDSVEKNEKGKPIETHIVFEPNQIRSIFSEFNPELSDTRMLNEQDDIRYYHIKLIQTAYNDIFPKLHSGNARENLRKNLEKLSNEEILKEIDNYKNKPISFNYKDSLRKATVGKGYFISLNNQEIGFAKTKKEALLFQKEIKNQFIKKAELALYNPLRMNDLGKWSPEIILRELNLSQAKRDSFYSIQSDTERFEYLKNEIKSMGHDGIVYENAVEGIGTDSYIIFDSKQIQIINKPQEVLTKESSFTF